jgi:DNA-binding Lrp family transcriptional regulator
MATGVLKRIESKTKFSQFIQILREEFEFSARTAMAVLEVGKEIFQLDKVDPTFLGEKGKEVRIVVSDKARHGPPIEELPKVEVVLTSDGGEEDKEIRRRQGNKALRQHRILRMTDECREQGGNLTQEDLADILRVHPRTIQRDIKELKEAGFIVSTRGIIRDIGPSISHKTKIVKLYLEGKTYTEISRISRHSPYSIKRYIESFIQVVFLHRKGLKIKEINYSLGISPRLIKEYLELYVRYNTSENRERIRDLLDSRENLKKGVKIR